MPLLDSGLMRGRYCIALFLLWIPPSLIATSWDDISRLNRETVQEIVRVKTETDVLAALNRATYRNPVVISGTRHSQGGQVVYPGAIVLDMSGYNEIVSLSPASKTIVVQSGVTWAQIQQAINPHSLAIKVMQSSNIFSVGGSLGANVHGRDPNYGTIIETVKRIRIALASGEVVYASREEIPDLFHAAIGGYGLLGVILEVEIELTDNLLVIKSTTQTDYADYVSALLSRLDDLALHYGRCSIVRDESFLRECYSIDFHTAADVPVNLALNNETSIWLNSRIFNYSRHSDQGKRLRWWLQKTMVDVPGKTRLSTRNNAMRPPIAFLEYAARDDTDILQEYFLPIARMAEFMDGLRETLRASDVNLLSMTLRYLPKSDGAVLNYANSDMIAIVLYVNIETSQAGIAKAGIWTRKLVDLAIANNGTYYLTYQRFPSVEQFTTAYPSWQSFRDLKCRYDPQGMLMSRFYQAYFAAQDAPSASISNGRVLVCP